MLHVRSDTGQDRTRPYRVIVQVGSITRAYAFTDERERDRYAAQVRADVALLADRIDGRDR